MAVEKRDPLSGEMLTGHEWNGIWEINTRIPWPYWAFLIAAFLFSVGYWILMPTWPLGKTFTKGMLGHDVRAETLDRVKSAADARSVWTDKIATLGFREIAGSEELMNYVREDGHRLFGDNCAACHGIEATGGLGFPDLVDKDWLWGGTAAQIFFTITHGVNSEASDEAHVSEMMAFGRDGILDREEVVAVANYVKSLSTPEWAKNQPKRIAHGQEIFAEQCATCHGDDARGSHEMGAPDLTDDIWLYGGDINTIYTTIYGGRHGEMPAWGPRLTEVDRKILTLYLLDKGDSLGVPETFDEGVELAGDEESLAVEAAGYEG